MPIERNVIYKLPCRKKVSKRIREEWGQPGRTKVSGKPEANKLVKRLKSHSDFVITVDDIVEKNSETRVRESDELGLVPITSKNHKTCRAAINNHPAKFANSEGFNVATSVSSHHHQDILQKNY